MVVHVAHNRTGFIQLLLLSCTIVSVAVQKFWEMQESFKRSQESRVGLDVKNAVIIGIIMPIGLIAIAGDLWSR